MSFDSGPGVQFQEYTLGNIAFAFHVVVLRKVLQEGQLVL